MVEVVDTVLLAVQMSMKPSGSLMFPKFTWHALLTAWAWSPFPVSVLGAVILVGIWYLKGVAVLKTRGVHWKKTRTANFILGLVSIDLALQSPIATLAGSSFSDHVTQHMILMALAPPLLALGAPSTLLLQTSSRRTKSRWLKILHSTPFAVISNPLSAWTLYYGVMYVFFLTPLIGIAMTHMWLMDAINLFFVFGSTLFWWPLVSPDPIVRWKMGFGLKFLALVLGVPFDTFLGIALMSASSPVASMYSLGTTHAGGALLWGLSEFSIVGGIVPIFFQWYSADEREAKRWDRRYEVEESGNGMSISDDML